MLKDRKDKTTFTKVKTLYKLSEEELSAVSGSGTWLGNPADPPTGGTSGDGGSPKMGYPPGLFLTGSGDVGYTPFGGPGLGYTPFGGGYMFR